MQPTEIFGLLTLLLHVFRGFNLLNSSVPLFARNVQPSFILILQLCPSHRFRVSTQDDIGSTTGHIGGDRYRPKAARLSNDFRFSFVELRVQNTVLDPAAIQQLGKPFTLLDRNGADQNGASLLANFSDFLTINLSQIFLTPFQQGHRGIGFTLDLSQKFVAILQFDHVPLVNLLDLFGHRLILGSLRREDCVGRFKPLHFPIGGDGHHIEFVDLQEFTGLGHSGTGHSRNLVVELEEVLQRDRRKRLRLFLDLDAFFGFNRLMQPVTPLPSIHETTRELIDDDDTSVLDDVIHISFVKKMSFERVVDHMRPVHVAGSIKALDTRHLFSRPDA